MSIAADIALASPQAHPQSGHKNFLLVALNNLSLFTL
jgi:hypothetical protein